MAFFTHSFSRVIVLSFEPVMMSAMQNLIGQWLTSVKHYLLMCLLLSSPDRLPHNPFSLLLTGFAYFLVGLLLVDAEHSYVLICAQITLELVMLGLISYAGLNLRNSLPRFQQTFSALLGTNVIISAVTIPAYRFATSNGNSEDNLLIYVTLAFLIWNLAVLSLIFKRSFDISTQLSAMISFCYFIIFQLTVIWLFP
jgi:hypothetical protein